MSLFVLNTQSQTIFGGFYMLRSLKYVVLALALLTALPAFSDDKQKATKELDKVNAMATDPVGRRVVNLSMADMLNTKRNDLLMERRDHDLTYGSVFVAHQLINNGVKMDDISAQLKAGKNVLQIADDQHLDWKKVGDQAKALNSKIDDNLYKHFAGDPAKIQEEEQKRDEADNYNLVYDGIKADNDVSQNDISKAQDRYLAIRNRGEEYAKRSTRLSTADQNAAYRDNVRSGGPQNQGGASGGAAPGAGGPR
jgi:hypothetical protein